MDLIYCKKITKKDTLEETLIEYFKKGSPATYYEKDDSLQCGSDRRRSFNDLLAMANYYHKETTDKRLAIALKNIKKELDGDSKSFLGSICGQLNGIVFYLFEGIHPTFKNTPMYRHIYYPNKFNTVYRGYSFNQIKKMMLEDDDE